MAFHVKKTHADISNYTMGSTNVHFYQLGTVPIRILSASLGPLGETLFSRFVTR